MSENESELFDMEPDYIPGVFNYCDRWCEKCPFTSRCSLYAMEKDEGSLTVDSEMRHRRFWDELGRQVESHKDLLHDVVGHEGVSIDDSEIKAFHREDARQRRRAEASAVVRLAREYSRTAWKWLEIVQGVVRDMRLEQHIRGADVQDGENNIGLQCEAAEDMLEMVLRYEPLIPAKVVRAVHGKTRGVADVIADLPRDYDGSAKVALIAIDRSIVAWKKIRKMMPEDDGGMLEVLFTLGKLRKTLENRFPDARAFQRPGFDTHDDGADGDDLVNMECE